MTDLIGFIAEELLKLDNKVTNNSIKNSQRTCISPNKTHTWLINNEDRFNNTSPQGNASQNENDNCSILTRTTKSASNICV
jgi:hypothetical protein